MAGCAVSLCFLLAATAHAGPFPPAAGQPGSDAISNSDPRIVEWASGYSDYVEGNPINVTYANPTSCLGPAITSTTSHLTELGDGGQITLSFASPIIADGAGPDFAVFGNAFSPGYLKLAYVDVSEDGTTWYREPNYSDTPSPISTYGDNMDPTNISGLAGKYVVGYGVPFSLSAVGLTEANYVRIVDIIGNGTDLDSAGNPIYDPYPNSNGFNVSGVGVISTVPEPGTFTLAIGAVAIGAIWSRHRRPLVRQLNFFNIFNHSTTSWRILSMKTSKKPYLPLIASLALGLGYVSSNACGGTVVDFSDLSLSPQSHWSGPDPNGTTGTLYGDPATFGNFTSGGVNFQNVYAVDPTYGPYWEGFAYSNVVNTTTSDYTNQFASISGGGIHGPGSTYAVAYYDAYATIPTIVLPAPTTVLSTDVTNTTYAYYSMLNGDGIGDTAFSSSDSFQLSIQGFDVNGQPTGAKPVVVDLADGTDILTSWSHVDLSSLGNDVKSLQFSLTSTQPYTPSYFALGDLTVVPEPSTLALLSSGALVGLIAWRRRLARVR